MSSSDLYKKSKKKIIIIIIIYKHFFVTFLNWGKTDMVLGGKGGYFQLGMGPKFGP